MAARPFSGKTKPAQSVQVTQFRWVVREISGYSYRCSVGSESFSVSGLCSGCQRRFVRQTDVVSLRNCTPYVRMNATSSISCNNGSRLSRKCPTAGRSRCSLFLVTTPQYKDNKQLNILPKPGTGKTPVSPYIVYYFMPRMFDPGYGIGWPRRCAWARLLFLLPSRPRFSLL